MALKDRLKKEVSPCVSSDEDDKPIVTQTSKFNT